MLLLAQGLSGHAAAPGLSRAPPHPAWPPGPQPLRGSQLCGTAGRDHPAHSPAAFIGSGGRAGKDGGLAVATSGHRSIHRNDTALPSCHCAVERGWMVAGAEGLFLLWLMSLLSHAGRFALVLQAGRSLPGAGSVSHHDLSKKPCSGIFKPPPRSVEGSGRKRSSFLTMRCCRCWCWSSSPARFLFPPAEHHGTWRLHPINHSVTHDPLQTWLLWGQWMGCLGGEPEGPPRSPRGFQLSSPSCRSPPK